MSGIVDLEKMFAHRGRPMALSLLYIHYSGRKRKYLVRLERTGRFVTPITFTLEHSEDAPEGNEIHLGQCKLENLKYPLAYLGTVPNCGIYYIGDNKVYGHPMLVTTDGINLWWSPYNEHDLKTVMLPLLREGISPNDIHRFHIL